MTRIPGAERCGAARRALIVALALLPLAAAALEPWPEASYTYYADRKPVLDVLRDFCTTFGLNLKASARVKGTVDGRFSADTPAAFLDRLAAAHGLVWFHHAGSLYVARSDERTSRRFLIAGGAIAPVKQALQDMQLLNERFGWAEVPRQGVVVVTGPAAYVNLVGATLDSMNLPATETRLAVFRLRHARVMDRTMVYRDQELVIPGAASLLRNLMTGEPGDGGRDGDAVGVSVADGPQPLPGMGTGTNGRRGSPPKRRGAMATGGGVAGAVIEADVRLNALVIRDAPSMMPVYERLISQIDVPTSLVEIEALIVDVNKSRLEDLGIDWSATYAGRHGGASYSTPTAPVTPGGLVPPPPDIPYQSRVVINEVRNLLARIRALEESDDAKVLSKPMVLTTDNMTALMDLSETFYARVSGERVANLVPVTAGVMLKVTPHVVINADGTHDIQLVIDIEDGNLDQRTGVELPVVKRSVISTQAVIRGEQSLLIGGYDAQRNQRVEQKVPLLGDLPLIGRLFRSTTAVGNNRERLFLITPRVIAGPGAVAPDAWARARAAAARGPAGFEPPAAQAPAASVPASAGSSAPFTPSQAGATVSEVRAAGAQGEWSP